MLELAARLIDPKRRAEAARSLACGAGAEDLMIFVLDPEVEVLLPAPGFRQTLPDASRWQAFCRDLSPVSAQRGTLAFPDRATVVTALGLSGSDGSALVLLGGSPVAEAALALAGVLPILAAAFRGEQAVRAAEGHASVAREAAGQAKLLATSLDSARRELQTALAEAERANRSKDHFLAVLSHELRTPLAPVLTSATALLANEDLPAGVRSSLEMIRRNVELEARLIDDLLDLTRVVQRKMRLSLDTIDAHALIGQAVEICQSDFYRKELHLTLRLEAPEHHVRGDAARLQQVLWNLLKNAIKFTPAGGHVEVGSANEGGRIRIDVVDSGIGIEPQFLNKIFDAFEQTGDEVTHRFGGLGLGLAISKALVQAHEGVLVARSEGRGKGATFSMTLAAVAPKPAGQQGRRTVRLPDGGERLRLLVVEDHPDTAVVMSQLLKRMGHDVCTAGSVAATLQIARQQQFDLVLSDLGLPDGSGLDLMRQLSETFGLKGVAISGYGMEDDLARSKDAGFVAHLTKPINLQQLQALLTQFAGHAPRD